MVSEGYLPGDSANYLKPAEETVSFLLSHAFLENGNCAYLLSEEGEMLESAAGAGFDTSIYSDCFILLGLAEYSRVSGQAEILDRALQLYDRICVRIAAGDFRTEPYPVPSGLRSQSVSMILLRVTQVLAEAVTALQHDRREEISRAGVSLVREILETFYREDGRVSEFLPLTTQKSDRLLVRHVNPGHVFECMWFILNAARQHDQWIDKAVTAIKTAAALGWDQVHGGFFRFVSETGGEPVGATSGEPYERLILDTWDLKLWWPHSEALYSTLLAYKLTGDDQLFSLYGQIHEYVFRTFPNPDSQVGEWIQIRDRQGLPLEKCVALPVKDPYHVLQDVLLIVELLHDFEKV
jgi:N-acylglucosamine 2-epimerase